MQKNNCVACSGLEDKGAVGEITDNEAQTLLKKEHHHNGKGSEKPMDNRQQGQPAPLKHI